MDERIKGLWTTALRSGEFQQGTTRLKTVHIGRQTLHCCLGVLCELHDREFECSQSFENHSGELPDHVMTWAGLEDSNPYIRRPPSGSYQNDYMTHISFMNDMEHYNFSQLADLIEAQF